MVDRRDFIATGLAAAAVAGVPTSSVGALHSSQESKLKGRVRHSVCRWCYGSMSVEELSKAAAGMGIASVELLYEKEWGIPKQHGISCAVAMGPNPIPKGWNRVENHDAFVKESERLLPLVKEAGIPNMIVFSGNREGLSDAEGIKNCVAGLKRITPLAERLGVTVIMELLSSKDHKDYQCDRTAWGVEVVKGVGSDRFKLLYDIYHMQSIGHFHTGGVPGRNEIDETQELNYTTICKAIVDTGYTGFIGQEFVPKRDPMTSLQRAIAICDV
jgi:hydroxypyruvate isomerase